MGTMASAVGTRANYNEASSNSIDVPIFVTWIPSRILSTASLLYVFIVSVQPSVRFRALAWEPGALERLGPSEMALILKIGPRMAVLKYKLDEIGTSFALLVKICSKNQASFGPLRFWY